MCQEHSRQRHRENRVQESPGAFSRQSAKSEAPSPFSSDGTREAASPFSGPPLPKSRLEVSSSRTNPAFYSRSVGMLMKHIHDGVGEAAFVSSDRRDVIGTSNAGPEDSRPWLAVEPFAEDCRESWSRINVPEEKLDSNARSLALTAPSRRSVGPREVVSTASKDNSKDYGESSSQKWKLNRRYPSLLVDDPSLMQSLAENPHVPSSSGRKHMRAFPTLPNSESTSESSLRAAPKANEPQNGYLSKNSDGSKIVGEVAAESSISWRSESKATPSCPVHLKNQVQNVNDNQCLPYSNRAGLVNGGHLPEAENVNVDRSSAPNSADDFRFGSSDGTADPFDEFMSEEKVDLWYKSNPEPITDIRVNELSGFLESNSEMWPNPPLVTLKSLCPTLFSSLELELWEANSFHSPRMSRRVMMWSSSRNRALPFGESPTPEEVDGVLQSGSGLQVLTLKNLPTSTNVDESNGSCVHPTVNMLYPEEISDGSTDSGMKGKKRETLESADMLRSKKRVRPNTSGTPMTRQGSNSEQLELMLNGDGVEIPSYCDAPFLLKLRIRTIDSHSSLRLRLRPNRTLVSFSSLLPKFSASFVTEGGSSYFRAVVLHKVISRLRYNGMVPSGKDHFRGSAVLWNTIELKKEQVKEQSHVLFRTHLAFHPHLEPYTGQDLLLDLGEKQHLQLVPISELAPSSLVPFWNGKRRRTESHDNLEGIRRTVGDVINTEKNLELYVGQDFRGSEYWHALNDTSRMYGLRGHGMCKMRWVLIRRPKVVAELFKNGWTPDVASVRLSAASNVVFWDVSLGTCFTLGESSQSIAKFLDAHTGRFQPYCGQDLNCSDGAQLKDWFQLLMWGPGCRHSDMIPILRSRTTARKELAEKQLRIMSSNGISFTRLRVQGEKSRATRVPSHSDFEPNDKETKYGKSGKRCRKRKNHEMPRSSRAAVRSLSKDEEGIRKSGSTGGATTKCGLVPARSEVTRVPVRKHNRSKDSLENNNGMTRERRKSRSSKRRTSELMKLIPIDRVLLGHKEHGVVLPIDCCPTRTNLDAFLKAHEGYETVGDNFQVKSEVDPCSYVLAKMSAQREATRMDSIVTRIMNRSSNDGECSEIRNLLQEELSVCGNFGELVQSLRSGELVDVAVQLVDSLEALDVHNALSLANGAESEGCLDLFSVRERLQLGYLCMAHDVIDQFRQACASLIQESSEHSVLSESAKVLFVKGEQCFGYFFDEHLAIMRRDRYVHRIRSIIDQVSEDIRLPSTKSRRSGKILQHNAHLNFRDVLGNSIMSQGMSSRVLGILLDNTNHPIAGREHWEVCRNCYVCGTEVSKPFNDALVCMNRLFALCSRIVCRECLLKNMTARGFIEQRDSGRWVCSHCRGKCHASSKNYFSAAPHRAVSFKFNLTNANWIGTICAVFIRRNIDGEGFDVVTESCGGLEGDDALQRSWQCSVTLPVGFYRVKMLLDDQHIASTVLFVLPDFSSVNSTHIGAVGDSAPKVYWKPGSAHGSRSVESLRCEPIRNCSRTEGYNWMSAKRYALQSFCPEITGKLPKQSPTSIGTNRVPANLESDENTATDASGVHFQEFMLSERRSVADFWLHFNTYKVIRMRASLWSLVVARSTIHGNGLYTLSGYGTGDFIIEYAGDLIRIPLSDVREPKYDREGFGSYMFRVDDRSIVDATIRSNRSRFLNHSCDPNLKACIVDTAERKLIVLQAKRPIAPYTELTFDYQLPHEERALDCLCKAWNCTGAMN